MGERNTETKGINKNTEMVSRDPRSGDQGGAQGGREERARKCSALGRLEQPVSPGPAWRPVDRGEVGVEDDSGTPAPPRPVTGGHRDQREPVDLHMKAGGQREAFFDPGAGER